MPGMSESLVVLGDFACTGGVKAARKAEYYHPRPAKTAQTTGIPTGCFASGLDRYHQA
jgi:hypothetical protein